MNNKITIEQAKQQISEGFSSIYSKDDVLHLLSVIEVNDETNIDFDEASQAWNMNKKKMGGGCYTYVGEPTVKATFGGRR